MKYNHLKKYLFFLLVLIFAAGLLLSYATSTNLTQIDLDAFEYGQIAKNLLTGQGFSVNSYPYSGLVFLKEQGLLHQNWPNFMRYPLTSIILALYFKILGIKFSSFLVMFLSFFFFALIVFYLLSLKFLKESIALLSSLIFVSTLSIIQHSLRGLLELLDVGLFSLVILLLYKQKKIYKYYLASFIFGLSYLNHYINLFAFPVILYYIYHNFKLFQIKQKFKHLALCSIIFFVTITPLLIYNTSYAGNPFFTLQTASTFGADSSIHPYDGFTRFRLFKPLSFFIEHPQVILEKIVQRLKDFIPLIPKNLMGINIFPILSLGLLFYKFRKREINCLKLLIFLIFILHLLIYPAFVMEIRYFSLFIPFLILFPLLYLQENTPKKGILIITILILTLTNTLPLLSKIITPPTIKESLPGFYEEDFIYIKNHTQPNDIILGPGRELSFFSERKSFHYLSHNLLQDIETLKNDYGLEIQGIYFCPPEHYPSLGCRYVAPDASIPGFVLKKEFSSGGLYFTKNL